MISIVRRRPLRHALAALALLSAAAAPASASTPLDHPPTLYTFKLDDGPTRPSLLRAYFDAEVERPGPYNRYVGGQYGSWFKRPLQALSWGGASPDAQQHVAQDADGAARASDEPTTERSVWLPLDAAPDASSWFGFEQPVSDRLRVHIAGDAWNTRLFVADQHAPFWTTGPSLTSNGFDALWAPPAAPVTDWRCRRRPVQFVRYGGQSDKFGLVRCGGAVEAGAIDRLSILARPPEAPDPGELPDEPDPEAWEQSGEWMPRVKLVNPRLLWLLQKIADAFPHRAIYVYSGYRPHREKAGGTGHQSLHGDGRAMDIQVYGVKNETLFQYCRKLDDVGCGYYPNSKFVHVDVRRPGTGHAFWIDASGPGEPSRYVDSWPGVVERGALAWVQLPQKQDTAPSGSRLRAEDRGSADVIRK